MLWNSLLLIKLDTGDTIGLTLCVYEEHSNWFKTNIKRMHSIWTLKEVKLLCVGERESKASIESHTTALVYLQDLESLATVFLVLYDGLTG